MITKILVAAMTLLVAAPAFADGRYFFASGCTTVLPATPGEVFHFYGILQRNQDPRFPSPIPLNWDNEQHTMVIAGELVSTYEDPTFRLLTFDNVSIQIFTDVGPATVADLAAPATFQDGLLITSGDVFNFTHAAHGTVDIGPSSSITWNGGARLSEMLSRINQYDYVQGVLSTLTVPAGYAECWDLMAGNHDFPVEGRAWGAVKALYR